MKRVVEKTLNMLTKDKTESPPLSDDGSSINADCRSPSMDRSPSVRSPSVRSPSVRPSSVHPSDEQPEAADLSYVPQHPLPPEIGSMPRDDTVCKFCGVSYLIHNEIKKLEEELKEALDKIERLEGMEEKFAQAEQVGGTRLSWRGVYECN